MSRGLASISPTERRPPPRHLRRWGRWDAFQVAMRRWVDEANADLKQYGVTVRGMSFQHLDRDKRMQPRGGCNAAAREGLEHAIGSAGQQQVV